MNDNRESSTTQPGQPGEPYSADSTPRSPNVVRLVLLAVLAVMVLALAYDYLVARPAVDKAFEQIAGLNEEINSSAGAQVLTSADVRKALGREPSEVVQEDAYTTEVYRWRAGLPWRTYDYYVVYFSGANLRFATHFKHEKPPMSSFAPSVEWKPGEDSVPGGGDSPAGAGQAGGPPAPEVPSPEASGPESGAGESGAGESGAGEPSGDEPSQGGE